MRRGGLFVMMVAALLLGIMPGALAKGGIVEQEKFNDSFGPEVHGLLSDACGVTVTVQGTATGHFRMYEDGSQKIHVVDRSVFSSESGSVTQQYVGTIDFEPEEMIDNGDGTATVLVPHRENGTIRLSSRGEKPSAHDAGLIDWLIVVTIDLETGDVIDFHEEVVDTKGPHSLLEAEFGEFVAYFCDALTG